MATLINSSQK